MLKEKVQKFVAEHYKFQEYEAKEIIENENTLFLLMIWGIFEQKHFPGRHNKFMERLQTIPYDFNDVNCFNTFRCIAENFHNIYKDDTRWKNLDSEIPLNKDRDKIFIEIRNKKVEELADVDIIRFGLFVVYRYRNNIFHGLKDPSKYPDFEKEIEDCIDLLIAYMKGVK